MKNFGDCSKTKNNMDSNPFVSIAVNEVLEKLANNSLGQLVFFTLFGSRAYNTSISEQSDFDFLGVFSENPCNFLHIPNHTAMTSAISSEKKVDGSGTNSKTPCLDEQRPYEYLVHSLNKFCSMLVLGNPSAVDLLFFDRFVFVEDPFWTALKSRRNDFLTKSFVKHTIGHAKSHLKEAIRWNNHVKKLYHALRILRSAILVAEKGQLCFWIEEGDQSIPITRSLLIGIRKGEVEFQKGVELFNQLVEKTLKNLETCNLLEEVSDETKQWLDGLVVKMRFEKLRE